jgi:prepilin-type N-terminal cleavage/methylation domain-containing protein
VRRPIIAEAGFSLVEVLVAVALVAIAIVPLLQLYPGTIETALSGQVQSVLLFVAQEKTEELVGLLRANIDGPASGSAACAPLPNCRLEWTITTDQTSATQGVGKLKHLSVVACEDADASGSCGAEEKQVRYDTKVTSRP